MDKIWETARTTTTNKRTKLYLLKQLIGLRTPIKDRIIGGVPVVGGASGG